MTSNKFIVEEIVRVSSNGERERLRFETGVNVLVGKPNTGKTMWLRTLDYALGDRDPVEQALSEELATKYDSVRVVARAGTEEVTIERRWKLAGTKTKVVVDGTEPVDAGGLSAVLLGRLGIPVLHYPQGDPYGARTWPELSWRSLYRHIYRRQSSWNGLVDKQPESEQHACILQFLGLAEHLFSPEYAALVQARKECISLQAERDTFIRMATQIAQQLTAVEEQVGEATPGVISTAISHIDDALEQIHDKRSETLAALIANSAHGARDELHLLGEERARLLAEHSAAEEELQEAEARLRDMSAYTEEIKGELRRLQRAGVAGRIFSGLRITSCPACDRPIASLHTQGQDCFLCKRPWPAQDVSEEGAKKRLDVAKRQLSTELAEATEMINDLSRRRLELSQQVRRALERIAELEADLQRFREPAAAILSPALSQLDVQAGRLEERRLHWGRIGDALKQREYLSDKIAELQRRIDGLNDEVDRRSASIDFETAAHLLERGMNEYLTLLNHVRPWSWTQDEISVSLKERSLTLNVGRERWDRRLGGTLSLYFLLAYQYGLLHLTRHDNCHYPGLTIVDMPAELPDGESVADLENFVLVPFVQLLSEPGMEGTQLIVAGSSFEGLEGAHRLQLTHVYR